MRVPMILLALPIAAFSAFAGADEAMTYSPAKVVYDLSSPDPEVLGHLLDRTSTLQELYGDNVFDASIIIVVHEGAIPLFAHTDRNPNVELMRRASSLAMGEIIEFRLCNMSARMQGLQGSDFHDFVTLVPMADAEIVRLQRAGYAYLR